MVKFKFYDKKLKKYVSPFRGPEKVWDARYDLELWSNKIPDKNVKKLGRLMNKEDNFKLYVKVDGRYELYTKKIGKHIIDELKKKQQKDKKGKKKKE